MHNDTNTTLVGTIGGTLLSVVFSIPTQNIVTTIILACIGATTSFVFTLLLKKIYNHFTKTKTDEPKTKV